MKNGKHLIKQLEKLIKTPDRYHYVCGGGTPFTLNDDWGDTLMGKCKNSGERGARGWYGSKGCVDCDRTIKGIREVTESQRWINKGIQIAINEIKRNTDENPELLK